MSFLDDWKEWSTPKKAISILVVCCIGIIIVGALTGGGSPDKNTGSSASSGDNNSSTTEQVKGVQIKVTYSGDWSGACTKGSSTSSISGSGDKTIDVDIDSGVVSANAQKLDGGNENITIQLLKDGEVIEEASTDTEYGLAQVSGFV